MSASSVVSRNFCRIFFGGLGLLLNLKLENPLRKTLFISGGDGAVKKGCPPVLGSRLSVKGTRPSYQIFSGNAVSVASICAALH
jgi:hypothetical protein